MMGVGFVGFGRMGSTLALGAVRSGALRKNQVVVYAPSKKKVVRQAGLVWVSTWADLVSKCAIVFLCVKPQKMDGVLNDLQQTITSVPKKNLCFVSIAAGTPLIRIKKKLGSRVALFRVMPNTPSLLGAGLSAMSRGPNVTRAQEKVISSILKGVGEMVLVPEKFMDAITALSGSGPAYVFYLAEGMMLAAQSLGLSQELARRLVHQTIYGAGIMLKERKESAMELRQQVTSPGGTTAAALGELEKKNFLRLVKLAIQKAARRSSQLAKI